MGNRGLKMFSNFLFVFRAGTFSRGPGSNPVVAEAAALKTSIGKREARSWVATTSFEADIP